MAKSRKEIKLNIGTSSILFIFVILSLVSFAILSLVSAHSDYRLSKSVAQNTTSYYEACNEIEDKLAQTDVSLKALFDSGISRVSYFEQAGKTMSFAYPVSDIQSLVVEIEILYPENPGDCFYDVKTWQIITTGNLEYDSSLPVMK